MSTTSLPLGECPAGMPRGRQRHRQWLQMVATRTSRSGSRDSSSRSVLSSGRMPRAALAGPGPALLPACLTCHPLVHVHQHHLADDNGGGDLAAVGVFHLVRVPQQALEVHRRLLDPRRAHLQGWGRGQGRDPGMGQRREQGMGQGMGMGRAWGRGSAGVRRGAAASGVPWSSCT